MCKIRDFHSNSFRENCQTRIPPKYLRNQSGDIWYGVLVSQVTFGMEFWLLCAITEVHCPDHPQNLIDRFRTW